MADSRDAGLVSSGSLMTTHSQRWTSAAAEDKAGVRT